MLHWLPENVSTFGGDIDHVIRVIYYIVGAWFLLAEAVLFYFVVKFSRKEGRAAVYEPGIGWKPLLWILIPVSLILLFDLAIDFVQAPVWKNIKQTLPETSHLVRVVGRQFVWEFTHSGPDGQLGTGDDIEATNHLTVPVDTKILFELESKDVIHSLWIPNLRLKQDAVPGRKIRGWFEATRVGEYPIACAELCGSGHGVMQGRLHVLSKPDYEKWLKEQIETREVLGRVD